MHTNQAGLSSINIDYIHINVLLGYLQQTLIDILCNADNINEINKHGILIAINKLFWIQNEFFTMHYFIPLKDDTVIIQTPPLTKKSKCCWM
ncbi:unnamed protein product [Adineta steineri]|uniref:Globin-sensor domain-containing protein n=1 Tax=Adineta steineri TaxID=433720 RepID=A0A814D1L0_9BILA|nr:unnamed protein product [Adineta steineri]